MRGIIFLAIILTLWLVPKKYYPRSWLDPHYESTACIPEPEPDEKALLSKEWLDFCDMMVWSK